VKIGLTYDLKGDAPAAGLPDDHDEEFDSPATIEAIAAALRGLGHAVVMLGDGEPMLRRVLADRPDLVFNFAEGHGVSRSREARVPAALEMLGVPYTGSDPLTMAVTLDKDCARRLVQSHGGTVPRGQVFEPGADLSAIRRLSRLPYTAIVKPAWEGSSKGIRDKCVVDTPAELADALQLRHDQRQPLLVEEFIEGEELTVGLVGNERPRIIGVMRVLPAPAAGALRLQPGGEARLYKSGALRVPAVAAGRPRQGDRGGGTAGVSGAGVPGRGAAWTSGCATGCRTFWR